MEYGQGQAVYHQDQYAAGAYAGGGGYDSGEEQHGHMVYSQAVPQQQFYGGYQEPEQAVEEPKSKKRHKRRKKDPNAPKNPMSAYMFFSADKRAEVKEELGTTAVTEIAKRLGCIWRTMDETARVPYQGQANEDKLRYEREMSTFVPDPDWEKSAKKAKKAKKDPNAPKKPMSAFMIYYNEVREDIRQQHPEANFGGLSKIAGQRWREKTDEEKQPFQDKQAQAKVDYEVKFQAYEATKVEPVAASGSGYDDSGGGYDDKGYTHLQ